MRSIIVSLQYFFEIYVALKNNIFPDKKGCSKYLITYQFTNIRYLFPFINMVSFITYLTKIVEPNI